MSFGHAGGIGIAMTHRRPCEPLKPCVLNCDIRFISFPCFPVLLYGRPRQALEEQNLFFIQNSQETENALDELKQNFGKVQETMDTKTQVMKCEGCNVEVRKL